MFKIKQKNQKQKKIDKIKKVLKMTSYVRAREKVSKTTEYLEAVFQIT